MNTESVISDAIFLAFKKIEAGVLGCIRKDDIMAGKKIGTLFLSKEHGKQMENELAPERAKFRRQVKNLKKSEGKSEEHKTTEFIQNEEYLAGGNDGKLYGNTW